MPRTSSRFAQFVVGSVIALAGVGLGMPAAIKTWREIPPEPEKKIAKTDFYPYVARGEVPLSTDSQKLYEFAERWRHKHPRLARQTIARIRETEGGSLSSEAQARLMTLEAWLEYSQGNVKEAVEILEKARPLAGDRWQPLLRLLLETKQTLLVSDLADPSGKHLGSSAAQRAKEIQELRELLQPGCCSSSDGVVPQDPGCWLPASGFDSEAPSPESEILAGIREVLAVGPQESSASAVVLAGIDDGTLVAHELAHLSTSALTDTKNSARWSPDGRLFHDYSDGYAAMLASSPCIGGWTDPDGSSPNLGGAEQPCAVRADSPDLPRLLNSSQLSVLAIDAEGVRGFDPGIPDVEAEHSPRVATLAGGSRFGISYSRDALGRVTRVSYPDQSFETASYDSSGRLVRMIDRSGTITAYQYDDLNRLVSFGGIRGNERVYSFDSNGLRVGSDGRAIIFGNDQTDESLGRVVLADGQRWIGWGPVACHEPSRAESVVDDKVSRGDGHTRVARCARIGARLPPESTVQAENGSEVPGVYPATGRGTAWSLSVAGSSGLGHGRLPHAERDAAHISAELSRLGYSSTLLRGREASSKNVLGQIRARVASSTPGDAAVIHFAAHGVANSEGERWLDLTSSDETSDYLSVDQVRDALAPFRGRAIVVVDACANITDAPTSLSNLLRRRLRSAKGAEVMFAASLGESAVESSQAGGGVFTRAVVDYLRTRGVPYEDAKSLGFDPVTMFEAASAETRRKARLLHNVHQTPVSDSFPSRWRPLLAPETTESKVLSYDDRGSLWRPWRFRRPTWVLDSLVRSNEKSDEWIIGSVLGRTVMPTQRPPL